MARRSSILLIRSGAIGDFIVTLPVIQLLRRACESCRLVLVAKNRVRPLAKSLVDEFHDEDGSLLVPFFHKKVDRRCQEYEYLNTFDLIVSYLGAEGTVCENLQRLTRPRVINANVLPPPDYKRHITDFLLEPLSEILDISSPPLPSVPISEEEKIKADAFLRSCGIDESTPVVAVHPGSGGRHKVSPPANFSRAVKWIREISPETAVLAIEGETDEKDVLAFKARLDGPCATAKRENLLEVAAILSRASLFLGNDSGIAHLAAAVGTPAVVVFRASNPSIWAPRGKQVWLATDESLRETVEGGCGRSVGPKRPRAEKIQG